MHDQIQFDLEHSASIKLLRSPNAALVISFLQRTFKARHRRSVGYQELLEDLEHTLDALNETRPDLYPRSAQAYLTIWCDEEHRFLARRYLESDEPVFELTPSTEKVLGWVSDLNRREFIGTESRFLRIFGLLEEIAVQSSADPGTRLAYLERQKAELQSEIDGIRASGVVTRYNPTQLRERFAEAHEAARLLLADFKEVEENFREIARGVQEKQLEAHASKGAVLANVLDADEALKTSDQGRSFYAFWRFLLSLEKQNELHRLTESVYALPELNELAQQDLRHLKEHLLAASSAIVRSNQRLAEQLRRLLDEQTLAENKRVLALVADIKRLALRRDVAFGEADFLALETRPDVQLVMDRPLWEAGDAPTFTPEVPSLGGEDLSAVNTDALYGGVYIDKTLLSARIEAALRERPHVSLAELLERHPAEQGLAEILAYLSIASQNEQHRIDNETHETVLLTFARTATLLRMPQVVFRSPR